MVEMGIHRDPRPLPWRKSLGVNDEQNAWNLFSLRRPHTKLRSAENDGRENNVSVSLWLPPIQIHHRLEMEKNRWSS